MNNWKKIWENRKDNLDNVDKENYREVFAELKKIDGFDINGGAGDDSISNNYGDYSTIDGGAGNDSILNDSSDVSISCGAGNDSIYLTP